MQLGETLGDVAQERWRARAAAVIAQQPLSEFNSDGERVGKGETADSCCVCRCEYENGEELRVLRTCGHAFHRDCVDVWLGDHNTCPMCKVCVEVGNDVRSV